jgi:enoyl-[acyl-carrier protein] reductase II
MPDWTAADVLHTRVCDLFGIRYPVIQAGMGYLARVELAAAVSEAGGFGVIGSTGNLTPDELREEIRGVQALTGKPFAVNLLFPVFDDSAAGRAMAADLDAKVEVVLAEGVPVLGAGLGTPAPRYIEACRARGTLVMTTVGAVRHAEKAVAAGADVVVAQGWEAGGHNSTVASMALIPQVVRHVGDRVPVLAAGGLASGAGLIAALALGASGGYFGTVFAASREARAHANFKEAVIAARDTSTVVTRGYSGKPARLLRNAFTEYWDAHASEVLPFPQQMELNQEVTAAARVDGEIDRGPLPAGQIAGLLTEVEPAAAIVERIMAEARAVLETGLASR